jgi:hypothetical protein
MRSDPGAGSNANTALQVKRLPRYRHVDAVVAILIRAEQRIRPNHGIAADIEDVPVYGHKCRASADAHVIADSHVAVFANEHGTLAEHNVIPHVDSRIGVASGVKNAVIGNNDVSAQ